MNNKAEIWLCPFKFNYIGTASFKRYAALRMRAKQYGENNCLCLRSVTCLLNETATRNSGDRT